MRWPKGEEVIGSRHVNESNDSFVGIRWAVCRCGLRQSSKIISNMIDKVRTYLRRAENRDSAEVRYSYNEYRYSMTYKIANREGNR